ncbi:alpha/beta hydrolase [Frankia sp. CNm7]|uniref:Alpha/beta hydrolase n=1 Tax=Frankia nepalensis TaxID=1836974 RepID=A0A937RP01_9ACTN|nr:alpha/beta hydrolase [Frankia nepalensis]MBL7498034.1 alpha/beta hydrolase [Frankia nepalensis]MBL7513577.1 alpha/beta hydrolase [Frankia nepalensis]MBL7518548.1 alpha/beta hydrolase [Frankia nepalensis]MBL7629336.1 alpha/beta hydrolase [Frankia nepalensis]
MPSEGSLPAPPFDRELQPVLATGRLLSTVDVDTMIRSRISLPLTEVDAALAARGLVREDHLVPGLDEDPEVTVSVIRKQSGAPGGPGFYFAHGGGMVTGDRFSGMDRYLDWIELFDAVVMTVEYRRAPEHPDPAPLRDCYAGLVWTAARAMELGFDPGRLFAVGLSAGGGLVAGSVLLARDYGGPRLAGQLLLCPMLDDRDKTLSSRQIRGIGVWDGASNAAGWSALLGDRRGTDAVSIYSAPARATDLAGLPPTYLDCGSAEVFRDEVVAYAGAIWAAGGSADLRVWAGGFHGFDGIAPGAAISAEARAGRVAFLRRVLRALG